MEDDLKEWVGSPKGRDLIRRVAVSVLHEVTHGGLVPPRLVLHDCRNMSRDDLLDECIAEISFFLVAREDLVRRILSVPDPSAAALLKTAVVYGWKTLLRSPRRDPFRYLYKRACDVLRAAGRTTHLPAETPGVQYSFGNESIAVGPLAEEDLRAVSFPMDAVPRMTLEAVTGRNVLLTLAEHFWQGVAALWNGVEARIAVRDFVGWIALHIPLSAPGETIALEQVASPGEPPRIYFDPEPIRQWAGQCAALLSAQQGAAFYFTEGEGIGLDETARRLGYRSASGAKYAVDRAREVIRYFLRDLPWVSPDDLDEEAFSIFRDELLAKLKSGLREP